MITVAWVLLVLVVLAAVLRDDLPNHRRGYRPTPEDELAVLVRAQQHRPQVAQKPTPAVPAKSAGAARR